MPKTVRSVRSSPQAVTIMGLSASQAQSRTEQQPADPVGWKSLGAHHLESGRLDEARSALDQALRLAPQDPEALRVLADLETRVGDLAAAREALQTALDIEPTHILGQVKLAEILYRLGLLDEAIQCLDQIPSKGKHRATLLSWRGLVQLGRAEYDDARQAFEALIAIEPKQYSAWNNLGNVHRDLGDLEQAEACYARASSMTRDDPLPRSNWLTALHYNPQATVESILQVCKDWGAMFVPQTRPTRPTPADRSPGKVLRVGMFSDGFRQHPVGMMTTSALEHLCRLGVDVYAYTTNAKEDHITQRVKALARRWTSISHLNDDQFAQLIRDDQIDILIDLSGHNAGSRMRAVALEPAPVLVKWVGGLINTTGVEAIDYLITDSIESPPGSDYLYTEKLIRLPDDYICFMPPQSPPAVAELPALRNGYITFGCFNNPTKINEVVLAQWAQLMHDVPQSRLFLKGAAYGTEALRQRILSGLEKHGIEAGRVRIEGRSPHLELLARYNEVDIALDPWPYSGGLTTCEAMLMGVPVVTLPGPTFAGRHSATHLVNAGMPELVVQDWDQYRGRAMELASDLQSLATIRSHLRQMLLESPVCDSARFGSNLANALRAIWQRYCEGDAPAALAFTPDGQPWFEDKDGPTTLLQPDASALADADAQDSFSFSFQGKIVALDHGGALIENPLLQGPGQMGTLNVIALDPASRLQEAMGKTREKYISSYHNHIALGDGEPGVLYACLNAEVSGTLEPLPPARQLSFMRQHASVLARLPISTVRLDNIDGLDKLDWLILNETYDNEKILLGGQRLLEQVLVVHIRVLMAQLFEKQPDLSSLIRLLAAQGFNLLQLCNPEYGSYFPEDGSTAPHRGSQLLGMDAVFVPSEARLKSLTANQRLKLAFLLHTSYGAPDVAYAALRHSEGGIADRYLASTGWLVPDTVKAHAEAAKSPLDELPSATGKKRFVHLCYNNVHTQNFIDLMADSAFAEDFAHQILVEKARSIPNYDIDLGDNPNAVYFSHAADMQSVLAHILQSDVEGVFIHGLFFEWQKTLIRAIGDKKKIIWIMWGGDLYNPIKGGKPLFDVVEHIDAVATGTDGDYRLFRETYGERPRLQFAYPSKTEFQSIEQPRIKSKTIFVGNSGDPANMHLEILEALSTKPDIGDYEIVLPLSYNLSPAYEQELRVGIANLKLESQVRMLTEFMPSKDYFKLLANSEMVITAHHRQQALGNLMAALYFGCKSVLRKEIVLNGTQMLNPGWELLTSRMGTHPIDYADFLATKKLAALPVVADEQLEQQRAGVLDFQGTGTFKDMLKQQFSAAALL
ncbi:TDP-N-acetylfucosamine:lipid II N-acetylfucosaminyltransferase [Bordetella genomosp. 13]|uniref:protein O-GlcNAc transferase n=1 Tax=Bordetella genomosp. 13 TaxID=463040 RepID=A0A1W6ZAF0_9BORD|nr:TDP-N-acetylfucosamine:lipid II N-acetylfucosaminyltransferase [Bordetella genomosp. 13]ARP94341.1 hypothetical protein CAL15_08045 [Bordetella genomosp. 13]